MDIVLVPFESNLIIIKNNQKIQITPFMTQEHGNIKIGVEAPKEVNINREEIYLQKKTKT